MSRVIHSDDFEGAEPDVGELRQRFPTNTSRYGATYFLPNSAEEKQFSAYCQEKGFKTRRKTIIEYEGPSTKNTGLFIYLTLKNDEDGKCIRVERPGFVEFSGACPGGGAFGICDRGAKQISPAVIDRGGLEVVTRLGFISPQYPFNPSLFLISSRIKDLLVPLSPTGCEVLPCRVASGSSMSSATGECFQLKITGRPVGPVRVGDARIWRRCPNCGAVKGFSSDEERFFLPEDLSSDDFQMCELYQSNNLGSFVTVSPFPIVSQRVFDALLTNKIGGLFRYSTDPPIKYAVVQVQGQNR